MGQSFLNAARASEPVYKAALGRTADMRVAQVPSRRYRSRGRKLLAKPSDHSTPASEPYLPWTAEIGPSSMIRARKALCVAPSLAGSPRRGNVDQTIRPFLIEANRLALPMIPVLAHDDLRAGGDANT
jgi:hypothetical protein